MAPSFENKSVNEIANEVYTAAPEKIDSALKSLETLDAKTRAAVIDKLETISIEDARSNAEAYQVFGPMVENLESLSSIFGDAATPEEKAQMAIEDAKDLAELHAGCKIISYVADAKGKKAHPVIKEMVKTLSTLSDSEFSSWTKLAAALAKAYDRSASQSNPGAAAPNPYKKPQGPKHP